MEVQRARVTCSESQSSRVKLGFERDFARLMSISSPSTHGLPEKVCKMKTHHQRDDYSLLLKLWCGVWTKSIRLIWVFARNVESQAPPETSWLLSFSSHPQMTGVHSKL